MRHAWLMAMRVAGLLCALLLGAAAQAAQLSVGAPRIGANGWEMPVILAPGAGENVSSMQFDVVLPSGGAGASAQVSDAAALAGKQVMYSTVAPGQVRVVIAGLNQSPLAGGQVATLYLGPATAGQAAPSAMLSSPVLASPSGDRVPVEANTETPDAEEGEPTGGTEADEDPDGYTPPKSIDSGDTGGDDEASDAEQDESSDAADGSMSPRSRLLNGYPPFGNGMGAIDNLQEKAAKKSLRKSPPVAGQKAASGLKTAPMGGAGQEYRDATERARNAARNPAAATAQKYVPVDQRNRKKAIAESSTDGVLPSTGSPEAEGGRVQLADAGLNREDWGKAAGHDDAAVKPTHAPGAAMPLGTASLTANGAAGATAVVLCAIAAFVSLLAAVYLPLPWLHRLLRFNRSSTPADE